MGSVVVQTSAYDTPPHESTAREHANENPLHRRSYDDVVVDARTHKQDEVTDRLERLEVLPHYRQGEDPDEDRTDAVEHHTRSGTHGFGHRQPGKVEESDAHNETEIW